MTNARSISFLHPGCVQPCPFPGSIPYMIIPGSLPIDAHAGELMMEYLQYRSMFTQRVDLLERTTGTHVQMLYSVVCEARLKTFFMKTIGIMTSLT